MATETASVGGAKPSRLSTFIHERRDDIIAAWASAVSKTPTARHLGQPALADSAPDLLAHLAELIDRLAGARPSTDIPELDAIHTIRAIERLGNGFDLAEVVSELGALRECITILWEEESVEPAHLVQIRLLDKAIDGAVTASIDRYTRARHRALQAIDRLANAALESRTLDDFLERLLQTLVETASLDTATILMREGDLLRVRASVGLDHEVRDGITEPVGEGFAGTIAATRKPLELRDASTDPLVQRRAIREAGVRALYGVPLADGDNVIAVAHIGSTVVYEFSDEDKKLFSAMASRATSAIFQHLLRETAERTAELLRAREDELRAVADNMPQLAWMADATGAGYWYNRRWYEYTGLTPEQSVGITAIHPDHRERALETWQRATTSGTPWEETFPLCSKGGRYRWFLTRAVPIRDDHGAVVRWFGTNTDITDQRFLDEATKILNSSLDYNGTLDRVARLAVPDLCDWCAVHLVEPSGVRHLATAHIDPEQLDRARELTSKYPIDWNASVGVANVMRTGKPEYGEVSQELLAKSARTADHLRALQDLGLVSYIVVPISARGRTLGAITLVSTDPERSFDASEIPLAAELGRRAGMAIENARLYKESQDAIASREELIAIVSHDLRNPLGAIDLAATNLLEEPTASPRERKQFEIVRRSALRMKKLLDDLLDMATIQASHLKLEIASHDLERLVADVVDAHHAMAAERKLQLVAECDVRKAVACDRSRIEQVFGNLIGNAIKYCRAGDVIRVHGECTGEGARFSVADTGPGIGPDEIEHVFEPYWSAKRHAIKTGTGLGLYIAKGIVDAHGGTLTVHSTLGHGATFVFTLPCRGQ